MSKAVFLFVGSLFGVAMLPGALAGCGDSCEDLQEICDRCTDADYKASCETAVQDANQNVCDAQKTNFNQSCPFVATTSSTTTTSTASGGGNMGTTTTTAGTGGTMNTGGSSGGNANAGGNMATGGMNAGGMAGAGG